MIQGQSPFITALLPTELRDHWALDFVCRCGAGDSVQEAQDAKLPREGEDGPYVHLQNQLAWSVESLRLRLAAKDSDCVCPGRGGGAND